MSQKLDYTSRFVQQCFSRNLGRRTSLAETRKHGLAEAGQKNTASQRRNTKQHDEGKDGSKLRETLIQNITRFLKRFHGFASSWSLLNQRTKRCCVCLDFTAARCDKQATKCAWLGRVSIQNSTCHVKDNKNMRFRGNHQGHVPRPTRKK